MRRAPLGPDDIVIETVDAVSTPFATPRKVPAKSRSRYTRTGLAPRGPDKNAAPAFQIFSSPGTRFLIVTAFSKSHGQSIIKWCLERALLLIR
jgi:hypothetical protein